MLLNVKVIPNAGRNEIKREGNCWKVHLRAPAEKGKANKLLIKLFSQEFKVKKNQIKIVQGGKSRCKIVQIGKNISDS
ncbi:YggU family protein [bacterium]|nr:YggU family protein [bacterium]